MTNPNNAVGTNAAYGGRTSVNAFNDDLTIYSRGILSGWSCSPKSGMTVQIGGNGADRDAAVAEDNAGNKTSINNISGSPIDVTIPAAPATNNRIDLIVAYADNPPSGTSTVVDNPAACGIIVVSGTAASSPTAPTNAAIRSAITADGASGSTAYYVILAQIRVGTSVTTIGSGVITQGAKVESGAKAGASTVSTNSIADGAVTSNKVDYATFRLAVPDYASRQAFSSTTYTVPADGWVDVRATLAHGGDVSEHQLAFGVNITRGGITYQSIARSGIYSLTRWTQFNAQATVPVRSGDVVTLTTTIPSGGTVSWDARYFYPVKWG